MPISVRFRAQVSLVLLFGTSFLLALAGCGEQFETPEPVFLQASGSTTMGPVVERLAAAYHERFPLVTVGVTGLGTGYGLDALRSGEADIALASWLPVDLPPDWRTYALARDGIAIVVHPSNPVDGLGLLQLRDLFGGRTRQWRALAPTAADGPVQPVSREEGSGTRAAFEALVMQDRAVTPLALVAYSSQSIIDQVSADPAAIGYVSMSYVTPGVKVLKIEGELPTPESAAIGSYALTRELWLISADSAEKAVEEFIGFARGPVGQQIVGETLGRTR
jgi:phosphate transport system substrate-binding protein